MGVFTFTLLLWRGVQDLPAIVAASFVEVWPFHPRLHPHVVVPAVHRGRGFLKDWLPPAAAALPKFNTKEADTTAAVLPDAVGALRRSFSEVVIILVDREAVVGVVSRLEVCDHATRDPQEAHHWKR